jgi:hypothetical protein
MVRIVLRVVICWMAKPGKKNGSVGKKEHLIHDLLEKKPFPPSFSTNKGCKGSTQSAEDPTFGMASERVLEVIGSSARRS